MSSNMKFVYNNSTGTYVFDDNPTGYSPIQRTLQDVQRSTDGHLITNFKGEYTAFHLSFDHIGTNQFAQFLTIFNTKKNIVFYPYDEIRGTSLSYTVKWLGDFTFVPAENFWAGGCNGDIVLEVI